MTFDNPVFVTYVLAATIMILKMMGQGWMTVYRMMKVGGGYAAPEDLRPGLINKAPNPTQLEVNDYVDRSRRMHRNDLENIPAFWAAGLIFVAVAPPLWLAQGLLYGFVWNAHWPASMQWLACVLFVAGILASIKAHR